MIEPEFEIIVVGAGFAGLGLAAKLKQNGYKSFLILEKGDSAGGVWRDNVYPGCVCDVPSLYYSYSFFFNYDWKSVYAGQKEILAYLNRVIKKYDLSEHIRFNASVSSAHYGEPTKTWTVNLASGAQLKTQFLVVATGGLRQPAIPDLQGIEDFKGKAFHTSRWDRSASLNDKQVAVIGTGASGVQVAAQLANVAKKVHLFQRTPAWVFPKGNERDFSYLEKVLLKYFPAAMRLPRIKNFLSLDRNQRASSVPKTSRHFKTLERTALEYLNTEIGDPDLRKKLTPLYYQGCKRRVFSNDYYRHLNNGSIELHTDRIIKVTESGIVTGDQSTVAADIIVFATGFRPLNVNGQRTLGTTSRPNFVGQNGVNLYERWAKVGTHSYKGLTYQSFPNFFTMVGPNSGLGSGSIIFMMEAQINYILHGLKLLKKKGYRKFELKANRELAATLEVERKMRESVWLSDGCRSYYQNVHGKISAIWPGSALSYWRQTHRFDIDNYDCE